MPDRFTLDLDRITVGEMMDVEIASGRAFMDLVRSRTGLLMVSLYLRALQQHAHAISQLQPGEARPPAPSWRDMEGLTPSAVLRYVSPESVDSDSKTSDS